MVKKVKTNLAGDVKKVKANLASDIVEANILTKLPVKTLIRFTSVCKSWYSLFYDPYFINMYNKFQKNKFSNLLLINKGHVGKDIVFKDSYSRKQLKPWSFSHTINFTYRWVKVIGCCDGVVCVYTSFSDKNDFSTKGQISLWNPALRISKIIANFDQGLRIGFGYNSQTKNYNVITFINYSYRLENAEIYSLASDSWRKIELGPNMLLTDRYVVEQFAVYVSCYPIEAYCWIAHKTDQYGNFRESSIISFCMKDEAFKELMLPINTNDRGVEALFIYKDSLAMLHTCDSDAFPFRTKTCTIWVMKEYEDPKSWTKLYYFNSRRSYVSFVGVRETDQILLQCVRYKYRDRLYLKSRIINKANVINIDKSQMKRMSYTKDIMKARWVCSFTESLALLKGS